MTVKEFYSVSDFPTSFSLDLGNGEEVLISKEDKALIDGIGQVFFLDSQRFLGFPVVK